MSQFDPGYRIFSRPVRIHWAGWETDTLRLQQAGWQLSAEQDPMRNTMRLALRHEQIRMEGLTELEDWYFERTLVDPSGRPLDTSLRMRAMGRAIMIHEHAPFDFAPIDAAPSVTLDHKVTSLSDLAHFAAPLVRTQALVLPEATVDQLLSQLLEKQQAAKTDYFKDMVAREGSVIPAHKFHAQIISLREAA